MNGIDNVIRQLENQKAAIEKALEALREVEGNVGSVGVAPSAPVVSANDRRSAAQKKRWAAKKAAATQDAPVAVPGKGTRKGGMRPEGKVRLVAPEPEQTPAEATEPAPRRVMTVSAKKKLVSFTAERWRIVKEAGLDPGGHLPSNEMLEKAKKILARRAAK